MYELSQIILLFFLFQLFLFIPLNVFKKKNYQSKTSAFNLILNLNILLLLSLMPLSINKYSNIIIIVYFLMFLKQYVLSKLIYNIKIVSINFFIFFIIFFTISVNIASYLDLGWDAKFFYYIKALFFIEKQTLLDLKNFQYNDWHPHFGSFIWALFWDLSFLKIEYFGRLFYVFIFIFSFLYVSDNLSKNRNINLIIFLLITLFIYSYDKFSGLQEIIIFTLLIFASKFLHKIEEDKDNINIIFILLICNLLIWIKSEGFVYSLILITLLNFNKFIKISYKYLINAFILVFFLIKLIFYESFNLQINAQPYYLDYILKLSPELIFYKLKFILIYFIYYSLNNLYFTSGILIIAINNIILKKKNNYIKLMNVCLLLNFGFIFLAYLFRDMEIEYSIRTTMNRIIFMSSGLYLYTLLMFFRDYEFKKER